MAPDVIVFWMVTLSCVTGFVVTLRRVRSAGYGWVVLFLCIVLLNLTGWLRGQTTLIYASAGMWILLVLLPGFLARIYQRRLLEARYGHARRLARIISWLHPADGWGRQPEIVRALELAQGGDPASARQLLEQHERSGSAGGWMTTVILYRITNRWDDFITWEKQHSRQLEHMPQFLHVMLRARGETGDLGGLMDLYEANKHQIAKLPSASDRDLCRLMLFAFCGRRAMVERLLRGSLSVLPTVTKEFWLATAEMAAGRTEIARNELESLLRKADPLTRVSIESRLHRGVGALSSVDSRLGPVLEGASYDQGHEDRFGARPSLFSRQARMTQILILLNLGMFAIEMVSGGSQNMETLFRLGALYPPMVRGGEWWRVATSLFLHFGPIHLVMNMLALWVLAPFLEFALGAGRFLLVYLLAGVGSMGFVMRFASGPTGTQMTVGASGSVMGLVGATGAIMLRGWYRDKAVSAQRRLRWVLMIVLVQTVFDSLVPEVSMAGHLSGLLIGFFTALLLRNRFIAG